jgi:hypothetical protein
MLSGKSERGKPKPRKMFRPVWLYLLKKVRVPEPQVGEN